MIRIVLGLAMAGLLFSTVEARGSGGHHYSYAGGHYVGGHGSSHRGGHYVNLRTGNHYRHHYR